MIKGLTLAHDGDVLAVPADIKRILGELDDEKLLDIMSLRPSVLDVEEASLWLGGDADIFGAGRPLKPIAGEIVAILTAGEEDEPQSAR